MKIMGFKTWVKHVILNESIKEIELNKILDKISSGNTLSDREKKFLDTYNTLKDRDFEEQEYKEYHLLAKQATFDKIRELLDSGDTIICNLHDKDGLIGLKIVDIDYNWINEKVILSLDKNEKHFLDDKFLYNIIGKGKSKWSLEEHDEYHEKVPIKNED